MVNTKVQKMTMTMAMTAAKSVLQSDTGHPSLNVLPAYPENKSDDADYEDESGPIVGYFSTVTNSNKLCGSSHYKLMVLYN